MREFKYKIWDIPNKKWVGAPYALTQYGNLLCKGYAFENMEDFEVCQYTGLRDKNGKEIYERDIILWGDNLAREKGTAIHVTVEFKSGCFGVSSGERFHEFYHYCSDKWDDSEITNDMWGELPIEKYFRACFEVIGNTYENPELLKGAK